jgi:hypothetical protein
MARRRPIEGMGDNSYEGNGTLKCYACKEPLRDHRRGYPCPSMPQVFHVERPRRYKEKQEESK